MADDGDEKYGKEIRVFMHRNFNVDIRLTHTPQKTKTIAIIRNAQAICPIHKRPLHGQDLSQVHES